MQNNPYTTTPGKIPSFSFIQRPRQIDDIVDEFKEAFPSNQIYKIMGIRGTGKTVVLREIGKELSLDEQWIVINLNVEGDLLDEFYDKLASHFKLMKAASNVSLSINSPLSINYDRKEHKTIIADIEPYLQEVKKANKRILVTIDEVFDKNELRYFISQCQIWVGEDYPIFMLTAGLEHNYDEICKHRNMTFFKRAPKKELYYLDTNRIIDDYISKFNVDETTAEKMALLTKGYAYAFQLLGYICWKEDKPYEDILTEFDKEIDNNAYQLIWYELSSGDKRTLIAIAKSEDNTVKSMREKAGVSAQSFQQSKDRLLERKLIKNSERGVIEFTLPRFREFVLKAERLY